MFNKLSAVTLLAATASAAAIPSPSANWLWNVKGFTSTCTAATCRYSFDVSAPAGPSGQPSFDATGCTGTSVQGGFKSCAVVGIDVPGDVAAEELNSGIDIGAVVKVKFTFEQNGIRYSYTGGNAVGHGGAPADFEIIPTEVYAVPVEA